MTAPIPAVPDSEQVCGQDLNRLVLLQLRGSAWHCQANDCAEGCGRNMHMTPHRPVGEKRHELGAKPTIEAPHALAAHNALQAACMAAMASAQVLRSQGGWQGRQ